MRAYDIHAGSPEKLPQDMEAKCRHNPKSMARYHEKEGEL
jgi:hypothetical protein